MFFAILFLSPFKKGAKIAILLVTVRNKNRSLPPFVWQYKKNKNGGGQKNGRTIRPSMIFFVFFSEKLV